MKGLRPSPAASHPHTDSIRRSARESEGPDPPPDGLDSVYMGRGSMGVRRLISVRTYRLYKQRPRRLAPATHIQREYSTTVLSTRRGTTQGGRNHHHSDAPHQEEAQETTIEGN